VAFRKTPKILLSVVSEIKGDEVIKRRSFLNNEEQRFFDGGKVLGETNGKRLRRDWFPERILEERQLGQTLLIDYADLKIDLLDRDSRNLDR